jgi:hypothetical protein
MKIAEIIFFKSELRSQALTPPSTKHTGDQPGRLNWHRSWILDPHLLLPS